MEIDFSVAFVRVKHQGILKELCPDGIEGSVLNILSQFPSNGPQHLMKDGYRSKLVNIVSRVVPGSVFCALLFLLYTCELFSRVNNKLICYANYSSLIAIVPFQGVKLSHSS